MWETMEDDYLNKTSMGMGHGMKWSSADHAYNYALTNNLNLPDIVVYLLIMLVVISVIAFLYKRFSSLKRKNSKPLERDIKCGNCGLQVSEEFKFCPSCSTTLQQECRNCHRKLHISWKCCPYCSTEVK